MPKYDYRCPDGHQYEKREGFDAPVLQPCQVCGIEARRLLSAPAIVFKGSGWYINDSRKGGPGSDSAPKTDSAASTDSTPAPAAASSDSSSTPATNAAPAAPAAPAASTPSSAAAT